MKKYIQIGQPTIVISPICDELWIYLYGEFSIPSTSNTTERCYQYLVNEINGSYEKS